MFAFADLAARRSDSAVFRPMDNEQSCLSEESSSHSRTGDPVTTSTPHDYVVVVSARSAAGFRTTGLVGLTLTHRYRVAVVAGSAASRAYP
jgi:hypothetical protein